VIDAILLDCEQSETGAQALITDLALGPRIDPAVRERIEARHRKWAGA